MYCCSFPSSSQSKFVERYFYSDQRETDEVCRQEIIIPDGTTGLMFVASGSIQRINVDGTESMKIEGSHLFGQKTSAVLYDQPSKDLQVFGVKFKPGALKVLFNVKSSELTNDYVDFDVIASNRYRHLEEIIHSVTGLAAKIDVTERFFQAIECQHEADEKANLFKLILDDIHKDQADNKIANVLYKYNITYKQLERLFKIHVGMTPKLYSRIIRFNRSFKTFAKSRHKRLTDVAYDSGYFDQMHFIKEVKKFTGQSPSQLYLKDRGPMEKAQWDYVAGQL